MRAFISILFFKFLECWLNFALRLNENLSSARQFQNDLYDMCVLQLYSMVIITSCLYLGMMVIKKTKKTQDTLHARPQPLHHQNMH